MRVAGIDVATDPIGVRSRLGFMPEHDCLPTDQSAADVVATLGEIAGLPARAARQRASDVLDLVGLDEARFRPIEGFSTGMRQRTKLAQALVADPTLVLLDEPTAGLDPAGRHEMLDLVRRLARFGISVVIATHLLDDVQATCDQVVMIDAGRLVAAGRTATCSRPRDGSRVDVGGRGRELRRRPPGRARRSARPRCSPTARSRSQSTTTPRSTSTVVHQARLPTPVCRRTRSRRRPTPPRWRARVLVDRRRRPA